MAERSGKGDEPGGRTATTRSRRGASASEDSGLVAAPTFATLAEAQAHIVELEADLAVARTTIDALLDKAERSAMSNAAILEVATRLDDLLTRRAEEMEKSGTEQEVINSEIHTLITNFDRIVRQRSRALAESEAQLRRKNEELERLNEMKVEFISIATHELRTPLTSIVGYLDLMTEGRFGDVPEAMMRPMASLRRNALRLKRLVDEMLDVSRIDSGRVTLYRTRCDIGEVVVQVVGALQSQAGTKGLELTANVDSPPAIYADIDKLRQVVAKLIASAIRHTPEGGVITVSIDAAPRDKFAEGWARLRVKGTGITIPKHMRNRLFEPFSAVDLAKHHTSSGPDSAGLGLYIARGLIDLHGGLISVDSEEGAYTEFTVLLPRSEPAGRKADMESAEEPQHND